MLPANVSLLQARKQSLGDTVIQSVQVVEEFLGASLEGLAARVDAIVALLVAGQERGSMMIFNGAFVLKVGNEN
jgi:hypothetical protein